MTFLPFRVKLDMKLSIIFHTFFGEATDMIAIKGTDLKNNFKAICDQAYMGETVIISRPRNENVVIISEKEYAEFEKTRRNRKYLAKIDRAIEQRSSGTMKEHELIDA